MDVDTVIEEYREYLEASDKTSKGINYSLKKLKRFIYEYNLELFGLNYKEAQEFQSWLMDENKGLCPATVQVIIGSLTAMYDYLEKRDLVLTNPFRLIDRVKTPFNLPKNIPSEKDMDKLLTYLSKFTRGKNLIEYKRDYKVHVLCELLYSTGIRIHEASSIRLDDINFLEGTIVVKDSKTKSERTVFLNDYVISILNIYINEFRDKTLFLHNGADNSLLFGCSTHLKQWLNTILDRVSKEIGIDKVTSHIFRHSFGYHMLRAGCDIRKIQGFLGHSRLNTTQVYTKVDTEALRNVLDKYHPRQVLSL